MSRPNTAAGLGVVLVPPSAEFAKRAMSRAGAGAGAAPVVRHVRHLRNVNGGHGVHGVWVQLGEG
eukprot:8403927-Pyramimonas_sp.AAC.2